MGGGNEVVDDKMGVEEGGNEWVDERGGWVS